MGRHRLLQLNELIHAEVDRALRRSFEPPVGCLLTIEEVAVNRDLSQAKIFVSVLPPERARDVLTPLREQAGAIRTTLSRRLPQRSVPKLIFLEDTREEHAARINRLLDESGNGSLPARRQS